MESTLCRSNTNLRHKEKWQENKLRIKAVTMIDHVTGLFEIAQYKR